MDNTFPGTGLPPHLTPTQVPDTPEAPGAGNAMVGLSPFTEPQDVDAIIKQLMLDRPLKLYIPNKERYPQHEFRIINSIPQEIADAHNKGWKEVTDPELASLFSDTVAGTTKEGKPFRPILCARPKKVGDHIRRQHRLQLQSLYAGMDPANRQFSSKYAENAGRQAGSKGEFDGAAWRIRV